MTVEENTGSRGAASFHTPDFAAVSSAAFTAAPSLPRRSQSQRSKFEGFEMSIAGASVAFVAPGRYSPVAKKRASVSFAFVAATISRMGAPMRRAYSAARALPKLPEGTTTRTPRLNAASPRRTQAHA